MVGEVADGMSPPNKDVAAGVAPTFDNNPRKNAASELDAQAVSRDRFKRSLTGLVGVFTVIL